MERTRSTLLAAAANSARTLPLPSSRITRDGRSSVAFQQPCSTTGAPAWRRFPGRRRGRASGRWRQRQRHALRRARMAGEKQGSVPMWSAAAARGCARRRWAWMPARPGRAPRPRQRRPRRRRCRRLRARLAVLGGMARLRGLGLLAGGLAGGVGLERDLHLRRCAQDGAVAGAGTLGLGVRDGAFSRRVVIAFGALLRAASDAECRAGQQQRHDVEFAGRVEVSSRAVIMAAYP